MLEKVEEEPQFNLVSRCIEKLRKKYPRSNSSQLATRIGMERTTFGRIERGEVRASVPSIQKLLIALDESCSMMDVI